MTAPTPKTERRRKLPWHLHGASKMATKKFVPYLKDCPKCRKFAAVGNRPKKKGSL